MLIERMKDSMRDRAMMGTLYNGGRIERREQRAGFKNRSRTLSWL